MIIRQPGTLDVVKIAAILFPESSEDQAECVSLWLQRQQEESFLDLVAVHKKKVVGFIAGQIDNAHLAIVWMKAETKDVLTILWNKVKQIGAFDSAELSTPDPKLFDTLEFKPVFTTMLYTKEQSEGHPDEPQNNESQDNEPVCEVSA